MRDNYHTISRFVKIVERHPEIYDRSSEAYRTRNVEPVWNKVASSVRSEIGEECTVEELKMKWKGIRSSFNRYKNELIQNLNDSSVCKKYYLYDALQFLDPFTHCKSMITEQDDSTYYEENNTFVDVVESESSNDFNGFIEWDPCDIKPDVLNNLEQDSGINRLQKTSNQNEINTESDFKRTNKRIRSHEDNNTDVNNEDLNFFKSILPDIKGFTDKEKRKLKMKILQLIDDLENERPGPDTDISRAS